MLPLPELTPSDSRLPFAGTSTKQGPQSKDGTASAARGFAEMLTAAVPPQDAVATGSGQILPTGGKELPLREADISGELPTAIADSANSYAEESAVQALPIASSELLQGGMPGIEPDLETAVSTDPVAAEAATETSMDADLAALQLMLPPLNPAADVAAEVPATGPAQALTVPFVARGAGLAGGNGAATADSRSGNSARAFTAIPGLAMSDTAVVLANDPARTAQPSVPGQPAELAPLLRDAQSPTPLPIAPADVAAGTGKAFAEMLSGGKEIRLESQDVLPRIQPTAAPLASPLSSAAALPAAAAAINLPVTDSRWGDALGERVTWMAGQKLDSAEIRLNPAELGPIRIKISMEENQAQVTFTAQHATTRDAIEQALPRLRELFSGEGLNLANADVNGDGVRHDRGESGRGDDRLGSDEQLLTDADEDDGAGVAPLRASNGLVDTFV